MLAALALGSLVGVPPLGLIDWSWRDVGWGVAATAPLLLGLRWCLRTRLAPVARLVAYVEGHVAPAFAGSTLAELALVAALAGLAEELLFRGVIQTALARHLPAWVAIAASGAAFGLAHWLTPTYAVLAGLVGAYLGWTFAAGDNLLVPILAHALYDLAALILLVRLKPAPSASVL